MGARIPMPLIPPQADEVVGEEIDEEINPNEVEFGEEINPDEVQFGEEITSDEDPSDEIIPESVEFGEALPQVIVEEEYESDVFGSFEVEEEQAEIERKDFDTIIKYAKKAGDYFMKAMEADIIPYKVSVAAEMAFREGFSPIEVAQIAWDSATDLERLHQPEMQDKVFLNAIQSGVSPQQAREKSNSISLMVEQGITESVMSLSNLTPPTRGLRMAAKPVRVAVDWAVRAPAQMTAGLPKLMLNSAFGLPKSMFEKLVKRGPEIEANAKFFRPQIEGGTPFDEYAKRMASVFDDLEQNHITSLEEANDKLAAGVPAFTLTNALDFAIESAEFLDNKSEVAVEYNKLMSGIKTKVRADLAGVSNIDLARGKLRPEDVFLLNTPVSAEAVKTILRSIDDKINWADSRGAAQTELTGMLWKTRRSIDDVLKGVPANSEYGELMDKAYVRRTRLDLIAKNFGISKTGQLTQKAQELGIKENTSDAVKKINGSLLHRYANSLAGASSRRQSDEKIDIAMQNLDVILKESPELGRDLITSKQVLEDLAISDMSKKAMEYQKALSEKLKEVTSTETLKDLSLSEALKNATINGSRRVFAMSAIAGSIGVATGIDSLMMSGIGAVAGLVKDTHGRLIGESIVKNFISEESKFRSIIVEPIKGLHGAGQKSFSDVLDLFAPGISTALIRKVFDDDDSAYDYQTNEFRVYDWKLIRIAIEELKTKDDIPTVKKMNQITDWLHEFRRPGEEGGFITLKVSQPKKEKNPAIEQFKKFEKGK